MSSCMMEKKIGTEMVQANELSYGTLKIKEGVTDEKKILLFTIFQLSYFYNYFVFFPRRAKTSTLLAR